MLKSQKELKLCYTAKLCTQLEYINGADRNVCMFKNKKDLTFNQP